MEAMESRLEKSLSKAMNVRFEQEREERAERTFEDTKEPLRGSEDGEKVAVELDDDVKDKRSANEIAVLTRILDLATLDSGVDAKKRMIEIQLEARKRIFLLELVEKVGWGVALAYQELNPKETTLVPTKLKEAADYHEVMSSFKARTAAKKYGAGTRRPIYEKQAYERKSSQETSAPEKKKREDYKFGACFKCGGSGHWAKECASTQKK